MALIKIKKKKTINLKNIYHFPVFNFTLLFLIFSNRKIQYFFMKNDSLYVTAS